MSTDAAFNPKDKVQQAICFVLIAAALALWVVNGFWYLFAVLFLLHFAELLIKGWHIGQRAGRSAVETVLMTMICGYTWWLPLEKSVNDTKGQGKS